MQYESTQVQLIELSLIKANEDQPRKFFDQQFIRGLAAGIKEAGITEPLLLRRLDQSVNGFSFEIVKGEQRWRAAKLAGITKVPALIAKVVDKKEQFKIALVSDVLRNGLELLDLARGLKRLENDGMSQAEIAKPLGQSQAWVWQRLQILKLDEATLKLMSPETAPDQRLPLSKALLILQAPAADRAKIVATVSQGRLSVAAAKRLVVQAKVSRGACVPKRQRQPVKLFQEFAWIIGQIHEKSAHWAGTPAAEFKEVIAAGKPEQLEEVAKLIGETAESLALIKKRVESVKSVK